MASYVEILNEKYIFLMVIPVKISGKVVKIEKLHKWILPS